MRRFGLAAILASILAPPGGAQPAPSASDAPFTCLFERLTAERRAQAGPAASQRLTGAPADGEQSGGAALDAILAALPACAATGRWTEAQRESAGQYVLVQLAHEDMRRRYAGQNVDLSFIDDAVAAGPRAMLQFDALVGRVRAQGVGDNRPDSAEDVTFIYLELARQAEEIRRGFSDPQFRPR